jgi:hypothetical protein
MAEVLSFPPLRPPSWRLTLTPRMPVATPVRVKRPCPPRAIRWALTGLVVSAVMTDRLGVAIGGFSLGLGIPMLYLMLALLLLHGRLALSLSSLALYSAVVAVAVASFLFNVDVGGGGNVSLTSMALLLVLYLPFVFGMAPRADNASDWQWTMRVTGNVLFLMALAGIVQFYAQYAFRPEWWFDISQLIPEPIRASGLYNSAIRAGSTFKANGFVSREPSNYSFWMAFGLLLELALHKRPSRIFCFVLALLLSYSGTGVFALAIGLLFPLRVRRLVVLAIGGIVILVANAAAGDPLNLAFTVGRLGEFGARGSSAYARYVAPLQLVDAGIDALPWTAWFGHGPGTILHRSWEFDAHDPTWAKLLFEYGIAGFVALVGFMVYKLAAFRAPAQLAIVLIANWLVMGGYLLTPESVCFLYAVLGMWPGTVRPALALDRGTAA